MSVGLSGSRASQVQTNPSKGTTRMWRSDGYKSRKVVYWTCCKCSDSGMTTFNVQCSFCDHRKCNTCETYTIKSSHGRRSEIQPILSQSRRREIPREVSDGNANTESKGKEVLNEPEACRSRVDNSSKDNLTDASKAANKIEGESPRMSPDTKDREVQEPFTVVQLTSTQMADEQTFRALSRRLLSWEEKDVDEIEVTFDWNIPGVFKPSPGGDVDNTPTDVWHPATYVVVLKDLASHNNFMATTCEEYLMRCWDGVWSRTLLKVLDRFTTTTLKGLAAMEKRAALGEIIIDLTERVAAAEKAAAAERDALAERRAAGGRHVPAWRHAQLGIPALATRLLLAPLGPLGAALGALTLSGAAHWDQKVDSVEPDVLAAKVTLAEERVLAENTKLDKVVAEFEALEKLGTASRNLKFEIPHMDGAFVDLSNSMVVLHFCSLIDVRRAMDFIEAWDWLCKAVREPIVDGVHVSTASYQFVLERNERSKRLLRISSHLGTSRSPEMKYHCWEALFQSCTVAVCSLKPRLGFGKGLELSFDMMISLAAAEFHLVIAGGIVFIGYRTVLFPTAVYGDCVQFHLITTNNGQINPYILEYGSRMLTENATQFKNMRCFLGWCSSAQVNLGSRTIPTTSVAYSGGSDKGNSMQLDGFSAIVQAGASAPLSAVLGLQSNFRYLSHRLQFTPSRSYSQLLQDTAKEVAMIYDAPQQRCWVVPKLSLLLHMSQVYASQCVDVPDGRMPSVAPHSDSLDLVKFLERSGETSILGNGTDAFCFRHLMLGLNTNLLKAITLTRDSTCKKLYGFEFMDVITQPGRGSCMKELKTELAAKYWFDIANVSDAVVVCANLGDAITAAYGARGQGKQCGRVPCGSDYLAVTICCLKRLIERRGGVLDDHVKTQLLQISENSFWDLEKDPFSACEHDISSGSCWQRTDLFQRLVSRRDWIQWAKRILVKQPLTSAVIPIPISGAVVFGTT